MLGKKKPEGMCWGCAAIWGSDGDKKWKKKQIPFEKPHIPSFYFVVYASKVRDHA